MPLAEIRLTEGYTDEARLSSGAAIADAIRLRAPARSDPVTVTHHEAGAGNYLRGGQARQSATALPDPCETVRALLAAIKAHDLGRDATYPGDDLTIRSNAGAPMTRLSQLNERAATRYRHLSKTFEAIKAMGASGPAVVYARRGTPPEEWPDGAPFDGIRLINRFEFNDIRPRQDVWNDPGEHERET